MPTTIETADCISSPMFPRYASIALSEICISSSGNGTKNVCSTFAACADNKPPASTSSAAKAPIFFIRMFMILKTVLFREFKHSTDSWLEVKHQMFGND